MRRLLQPKSRRGGFTLVELLVVIAIIGILTVLTVVAVSGVTKGQQRSNTISTMSTVYQTLQTHWAYVVAEARKETGVAAPGGPYDTMNNIFGPDTSGGERNRIIWIKMRLMEAFPISYQEITNSNAKLYPYATNIIPSNYPGIPRKYIGTYAKALNGKIADNTGTHATESSACLLMALSLQRNGTALNLDNLGSSIADTDGDGVKELVDNWGTAFTFFRFPTANQDLQNSNPASPASKNYTYADPLDPGGVLFNWVGPLKPNFENNVHKIKFNNNASYVIPTIVSSGPDGGLGLDATMLPLLNQPPPPPPPAPPPTPYYVDNIYSFQLAPGAAKGKLQ